MIDINSLKCFLDKKFNFNESIDLSFNIKNKKRIINSGNICLPFSFKIRKKIFFFLLKKEKKHFSLNSKKNVFYIINKKNPDKSSKFIVDNYNNKKNFFVFSRLSFKLLVNFYKDKKIKKIIRRSFILKEDYLDILNLSEGKYLSYKFDISNSIKFSFAKTSMSLGEIFANLKNSINFISNICNNLNLNFNKNCKISVCTTQSKGSLLIKNYGQK